MPPISRASAPGRESFPSVTLADLQRFADSLGGLAPASRYRILSSVKSLLAFGHRIGYLPFDVGRALRLPAVRSRLAERILPEADVHRILSLEANPRNRAVLLLLYASGVRVSELCGLCWRDVQAKSEGSQITVFGKGGKTRAVQLPVSVAALVGKLRGEAGEDDPVFPSRKHGGALKTVAVCASCARPPGAPASRRLYLHTGCAMHMPPMLSTAAHPIHLVQATLGHASITTPGRYLHARPQDSFRAGSWHCDDSTRAVSVSGKQRKLLALVTVLKLFLGQNNDLAQYKVRGKAIDQVLLLLAC